MAKTRARKPKTGRRGARAMTPAEWLMDMQLGVRALAGQDVNEASALTVSAVFACVRNIADDVSKVPLVVNRELPEGGKEPATKHPVYKLLRLSPNPEMSSINFRRSLNVCALLWGNGYAEIQRNGGGVPVAMYPVHASRVTPRRDDSGTLYYSVINENGLAVRVEAANMLHIQGIGDGGVVGYATTKLGKEAIGVAMAAERFAATFFGNGTRVSGVLEHPGKLGEPAAKVLRESFNAIHQGADNAHKVAVLEEGMKFSSMSTAPNDAQMLETRVFSVSEACRLFRMPPHMVFEMSRSTFANIEQQSISYVQDALYTWYVVWDQELKRKLFRESESDLFPEHQYQKLQRGDMTMRFTAYNMGLQSGWLNRDEVRAWEGLNPMPNGEGKVYLFPLNMAPADEVINGDTREDIEPATPNLEDDDEEAVSDAEARIARVVAAHEPLLAEAFGRVVRPELDKVQRASRHLNFTERLAAIYAETPAIVRREVGPVLDAFAAALWAIFRHDAPADALFTAVMGETMMIAARHVETSKSEAQQASKIAAWITERPARAAREEMDNVTETIMGFIRKLPKEVTNG